jgi:hypothetical protein
MASGRSVYYAKKSVALTNPITNDSIFLQSDSSALAAYVSAYQAALVGGTSNLDGKSFYVRATGKVTTGTSSTLIVTLYYATAARTAITYNGTGVSTTGATLTTGAIGTTSGNWMIEATFLWDYTSKQLNGYFDTLSSPTPTLAAPAVTTQITTVDLSVPGPGFVVGAHFGSTNASNVVSLSELELEVM